MGTQQAKTVVAERKAPPDEEDEEESYLAPPPLEGQCSAWPAASRPPAPATSPQAWPTAVRPLAPGPPNPQEAASHAAASNSDLYSRLSLEEMQQARQALLQSTPPAEEGTACGIPAGSSFTGLVIKPKQWLSTFL